MAIPALQPTDSRDELRPAIEAALDYYTRRAPGCPPELREAMRYSLLAPGKRLRPMLVLMAAEACGGEIPAALPPACAVEMIHAYSLIHDDLPAMDDDDLRRGLPTCHKQFGEALAILAGDALLALAFQVVAENVLPAETATRCCVALARAAGPCNLVGGQVDDVLGKLAPDAMVEDRDRAQALLDSIHRRKTGAMIQVSLHLGALVAGAGRDTLDALDRFGHCLGLAFQITDDLLDVRGNEMEVGKRVQKDSARGKLSFPRLLGIDQSNSRAEELAREACAAIEPLGARAGRLIAMAQYVLERQR